MTRRSIAQAATFLVVPTSSEHSCLMHASSWPCRKACIENGLHYGRRCWDLLAGRRTLLSATPGAAQLDAEFTLPRYLPADGVSTLTLSCGKAHEKAFEVLVNDAAVGKGACHICDGNNTKSTLLRHSLDVSIRMQAFDVR